MLQRLCVEIPKRMRTLPKDPRGYPVPVIVLIDKAGKSQFTINDQRKVNDCRTKKLCSICGKRLESTMWFLGGPLSAFAPGGAYIDGPMHDECSAYAVQVCPYLGAPHYDKRIDTKLLKPGNTPEHIVTLLDPTMLPDRPKLFIRGQTDGYHLSQNGLMTYYRPNPWLAWDGWRSGLLLPQDEAQAEVTAILAGHTA